MLSTFDGAIGSRWKSGANIKVRQNILRQHESRSFNLIIRILFGLHYQDTQCGAKVFKKSAIDAVLPKMVSQGFEFDVELLWRLWQGGYRVIEVPIEWQNIDDSRVNKKDIIRMLSDLLTVRFHSGLVSYNQDPPLQ